MTLLADHIMKRGHWEVRVFPESFEPKRIPDIATLKTLVRAFAVDAGGLSFPILSRSDFQIGADWIGQEYPNNEYGQSWRFYQSGQFILYEGFLDDWLGDNPGTHLSVSDALTTYWQAYELASRFATAMSGHDPICVSLHAYDLEGRRLLYRFPNRTGLRHAYVARLKDFGTSHVIARRDLIAESVALCIRGVRELFERFGWAPNPELLRQLLSEGGPRV